MGFLDDFSRGSEAGWSGFGDIMQGESVWDTMSKIKEDLEDSEEDDQ